MKKITASGLLAGFLLATAGNAGAITADYTITPTPENPVESLRTVTIDFGDTPVKFYEDDENAAATLTFQNNDDMQQRFCFVPKQESGNVYSLTFADEEGYVETITLPGDWVMEIQNMYVEENGTKVAVDPIRAEYTIPYPCKYIIEPDPSAAYDLQNMTITYPDYDVSFYPNMRPATVILDGGRNGNYECKVPKRDTSYEGPGTRYIFTFTQQNETAAVSTISGLGTYQLAINGAYITDEYIDFGPLYLKCYVVDAVNYTLSPASGTTVSDLTAVTLTINDATAGFYENADQPVALLENATSGKTYVCYDPVVNPRYTGNGKEFTLSFFNPDDPEDFSPITEPGNYTLTITSIYNKSGNLPPINASYTIAYPVNYTLNPRSGSQVSSISQIKLQFPNNSNVMFPLFNTMPPVVMENVTTGVEYVCRDVEINQESQLANGVEFIFSFVDEEGEAVVLNQAGEYQLTVRSMYLAGATPEEDEFLPVIYANYSIQYPISYYLFPDESADITDLGTISVIFPDNTVYFEETVMPQATLLNKTTGDVYYCQKAAANPNVMQGSGYDFSFVNAAGAAVNVININGSYLLTIYGLYTESNGTQRELPALTGVYTITRGASSGIDSALEEESGVYNVYSISGVRVVANGNAEDVKNLPAGLYIVNGKKVVVRN